MQLLFFGLNTAAGALSLMSGSTGWALFSFAVAGVCLYSHFAETGRNDER